MKTMKVFAIGMMACGACALALGMNSCSENSEMEITIKTKTGGTVMACSSQQTAVGNATPHATVALMPGYYTIDRTDSAHLNMSVMQDGLEVKSYYIDRAYADKSKQLRHSVMTQMALSYAVDEDDPNNKSLWAVSARNTECNIEFYDFIYNDEWKGDTLLNMDFKGFTLSDSLAFPIGNYDLKYAHNYGEDKPVYTLFIGEKVKYVMNYSKDNEGKLKEVVINVYSKKGDDYEYANTVVANNFNY